uniref:Nucleoside transporter n=1 Tax=Wuchereria bancrofti TaxID=6293 RepID=A0A1I8E9N8_WUCBA
MNRCRVLVFAAFMFISATSVLPWNLFINAHEYYHYKLRNVTENTTLSDGKDDDTELQRSYEGWVTLTGGVSCVFGSGINFLITGRRSYGRTIVTCSYVQLAFFCISMVLASLASFGSIGLIACGLLGFSAKFPSENVQAVMIGQSVAGILSSLLSIVCQSLATNALVNGRLFFVIAFIWTILSVFLYELLVRSKETELLLIDEGSRIDQSSDQRLLEKLVIFNSSLKLNFIRLDNVDNTFEADESPLHLRSTETHSLWSDAEQVWKKTKMEWWAGFIIFFGTMTAFPAVSSLVQTNAKNLVWKNYFSSLACFLLFNCGDAFGRLVVNFCRLSEKALIMLSFLRLLAIPVFFFCNINPRYHSVTLFRSDEVFISTMLLFSISNGFLFTAATINATGKVRAELRELAGSIFGFMAVISTLCGSLIGLLLVKAM